MYTYIYICSVLSKGTCHIWRTKRKKGGKKKTQLEHTWLQVQHSAIKAMHPSSETANKTRHSHQN